VGTFCQNNGYMTYSVLMHLQLFRWVLWQ